MTRQQEVQNLLDKIRGYVINDKAILQCDKVQKAKAFIRMDEVCENISDEQCEKAVRNILMEEIPWIVDVHVYQENR